MFYKAEPNDKVVKNKGAKLSKNLKKEKCSLVDA